MILSAARAGLAQMWKHKRLLVPFYLANVCFALLIMLPLGMLLDSFVGDSLLRQQLGVAMDYDFFFEFLAQNSDGFAAVQGVMLLAPFGYWLFALFLSGGALVIYANDIYRPAIFWGGAAACFGAFVRLALMAAPVMIILFCLRFLEPLGQRLIFGADPYEYVIWWGAWIKMALGYLGLILGGIVFDYARIHLVLHGGRNARKSLWFALKFAARNWGKTLLLALLFFCAGWVLVGVYYLLSGLPTAPHWLAVVLLLVIQQMYMLARMMLRLTTYAGQMKLYRRLAD